MQSGRRHTGAPRSEPEISLAPLTAGDIARLEVLERSTGLSFWGREAYRQVIEDLPEYYGRKLLIGGTGSEGILAGFLLARILFEDMEILKVGVLPGHQRRGFGSRMLADALSEGRERGCRRCYLEVRASNQAAIRFYHESGFRLAGRRARYYSDPSEDALIMDRELP